MMTRQKVHFCSAGFQPAMILSSILVLQFLLCIYGLFQKPLWLDEAYSAVIARLSIPEIHNAMRYDAGPPLYYDLLHIWRMIAGESEAALRLPSLICSMLTTALIFLFCNKHTGRETALYSTIVWVVSPLSVFYAVEARNYTFLVVLTMSYIYFLYLYLQNPIIKYIIVCTLLLTALLYTHNTAMYIIPASFMACVFMQRNWKIITGLLMSMVIAVLAYIPWVSTLRHQLSQSQLTTGWIEAFWTGMMPFYTFTAFTPGGNMPLYMDIPAFPMITQYIVYILFGGLAAYSIYYSILQKHNVVLYIYIIAITTIGIAWLQSILLTPTYLAGRTDFLVFPFWCIGIGYGVTQLPSSKLRMLVGISLVTACLAANAMIYTKQNDVNERELIKTLAYHANAGDIILCTGLTRPIVEYAFANQPFTILSYPSDMKRHLAHLNEAWYFQNMDLREEARAVLAQAVQNKTELSKIIVLWSGRAINQPLQAALDAAEFNHLAINEYTHPNMGLSRLNEPISLWIVQ